LSGFVVVIVIVVVVVFAIVAAAVACGRILYTLGTPGQYSWGLGVRQYPPGVRSRSRVVSGSRSRKAFGLTPAVCACSMVFCHVPKR
jgi:hypothetical protein